MGKQFACIGMCGIDFYVDVEKDALRQVNNPRNIIRYADMNDMGDCYKFIFSKKDKNISGDDVADNINSFKINIPQIVSIDPEGMRTKWKCSADDLKAGSDLNVILNSEDANKRIKHGRLPIINIMGDRFFVEIRLNELRHVQDFSCVLDMNKMDDYGEGYTFCYDKASRSIIEFSDPITKARPGAAIVQLPEKASLDIHSYCRETGYDLENLIRYYPIRSNMIADQIPWSKVIIQTEKVVKHQNDDLLTKDRIASAGKSKGL